VSFLGQFLMSPDKSFGIEVEMNRRGSRVGIVYVIDGQRKKSSELGEQFQWMELSKHIDSSISTDDIESIQPIRPTQKLNQIVSIPQEDTEDVTELPPVAASIVQSGRPKMNPMQVNLLAQLEDSYARFSTHTKEKQRQHKCGVAQPFRPRSIPPTSRANPFKRPRMLPHGTGF